MVYDPIGDRMILFGGNQHNDVWALSLSSSPTWTPVVPAGTPPPPYYEFPNDAYYDGFRHRMVVLLSTSDRQHLTLWALSLSATPEWRQLTPQTPWNGPLPFYGAEMIYDASRDRAVIFGQNDCTSPSSRISWAIDFDHPAADVPERWSLTLEAPRPNPGAADASIAFSIPDAGAARLDVFDAGGRRRGSRVVNGAGLQVIRVVSLLDERSPGIYFIRLSRSGHSIVQRFVLTD
jgi:hypothetical protein